MTLSDLSIKRPVLATVFSIFIVIMGIVGFLSLGIREYPSVDPPIVTIRTNYPGANAEIILTQITEPLEEEINQVEGIKTISSTSTDGRSTITAEFELGIDLDNAANDVRAKVSQALNDIPPDADPPVVAKADADAQTILAITLRSDSRSLLEMTRLAEDLFAERLQTIPGVSEVYLWGEREYAMRLILDPQKIEAYGITPIDIREALAGQNIELPTGRIEGRRKYLTIRAFGRLSTEEEFNDLIIAKRDNALVRISDLGRAELSSLNKQTILRGNGGEPMVGVAIQPQPGANYLGIVDEAFSRVDQIKSELPEDIELGVGLNATTSIRDSIAEVRTTIIIAFVLVLLIIFVFLRNLRTTLIPIVTIPISLTGAFAILYFSGFSINILTLLGMLLATGLVVDDAIVVMENIYSRIEEGMDPIQAAFKGSRQVFFAVIATTITLVCVFIPIFFIQGLTGALFREFAAVVAGSVIISTFVSLSLTAMMCSRLLKKESRELRFLNIFKQGLDFLTRHYKSGLQWFLQKRWLSFVFVVLIGGLIWYFGSELSSELAPLDDKSRIRLISTAPEGTSYELMDTYTQNLIALVDSLPEKEYLLAVTAPAFGASQAVNSSFIRLSLYPPDERDKSQMQLADELSREVKKHNFARTYVVQEPTISAGSGGGSDLPLQFVLQAPELEKLREVIPEFMQRANNHEAFDVVDIDLKFNKPELAVEIDRNKAMDMGVNVEDIVQTLQTYFSEQRMGYFIRDNNQYYVLALAEREARDEPQDLSRLTVMNEEGEMVALKNLVILSDESRPPELLRFNRYMSATISASMAEGRTLGEGITVMEEIADELLDDSFSTSLSGSAEDYAESSGNLLLIFLFSLLLVYLTLAAQFESYRDPFTIMVTVPLALAGALISLYIFGQTMNIFSQIGMIILVGIVTKNGILIVEFANQIRDDGRELIEAATEAAAERFRPILMTSLATVLGTLPLVLPIGGSANSRFPLGIVIIGGLLFSLVLTLFIIPALYTYIASKKGKKIVEEEQNA